MGFARQHVAREVAERDNVAHGVVPPMEQSETVYMLGRR
jgi:hypothetical protein